VGGIVVPSIEGAIDKAQAAIESLDGDRSRPYSSLDLENELSVGGLPTSSEKASVGAGAFSFSGSVTSRVRIPFQENVDY
jgi:hypothetical protein